MKNINRVVVFNIAFVSLCIIMGKSYANAIQAPSQKYAPQGYSIVTIETPKDVRFHATGLTTDKNNAIWVATRLGDVWRLKDKKWHKYAQGLHEATGILVEDDGSVLVSHKPELTKLTDTNGDLVADIYEPFASGWDFHDNYHEFTFGPVKNSNGDYIGTLNLSHNLPNAFSLGTMSSAGGHRGFAFKVTQNGQYSPYAWGLRSPAGIGASPSGEVFFTDNQGDWVPTSKMHLLQEGKFYGHPVSLIDVEGYDEENIRALSVQRLKAMSEQPVVWFPHVEVSNSPGNPEWDTTEGKFGPFAGQIFIGDQTQSNIFRVILDKVNNNYQGAVINFMNKFQSGNIRTVFDNKGQLWVGQTARGWGAQGGKPFGLQKVVWDGTNPFELLDIKLNKTGFTLRFTEALDVDSVKLDNFTAQHWHYKYSGNYGSPKIDLAQIKPTQISLSDDKKTIHLSMPLTPQKVVQISFDKLRDKHGRATSVNTVYYTLNALIKG